MDLREFNTRSDFVLNKENYIYKIMKNNLLNESLISFYLYNTKNISSFNNISLLKIRILINSLKQYRAIDNKNKIVFNQQSFNFNSKSDHIRGPSPRTRCKSL
jgi:hypothetical protein